VVSLSRDGAVCQVSKVLELLGGVLSASAGFAGIPVPVLVVDTVSWSGEDKSE
jgi:hypothetical protein